MEGGREVGVETEEPQLHLLVIKVEKVPCLG